MSALNREDLKDYSRAQIVEGQISEEVTPEKHNLVNDKLIESALNILEDRATGADFANPLETDPPKFVAPYELFLYFLRKSDKATQAEVLAGLNNSKFITPKGLTAALVGNYGLRDYDDSGVTTYAEGVGAFYDSSLYRCNNPAGTSGAWNADDWDVIGVSTVTGGSVDNTDPNNPIVNAVPLVGTDEMTGNIKSSNSFFQLGLNDDTSYIQFINTLLAIKSEVGNFSSETRNETFTDGRYTVIVNDSGGVGRQRKLEIRSNLPATFSGDTIQYNADRTAEIDANGLALINRDYADAHYSGVGSSFDPAVDTVGNITPTNSDVVDGDTVTVAIGKLQGQLDNVTGNTDLSVTSQSATGLTIASSTGTDAALGLGNGTLAGLSLNDYTSAEKSKLSGIAAGAEVNVNADWNAVSGDAQILNKPTISGSNTGDQTITLTGDVTGSGTGSFAATITNNVVSNSKLAQMSANTIKANNTGGTANAADLTTDQFTAMMEIAVAVGTTGIITAMTSATYKYIRLTSASATGLGGIVAPSSSYKDLYIWNDTGVTLILYHDYSSEATAANRILCGANQNWANNTMLHLKYDVVEARWCLVTLEGSTYRPLLAGTGDRLNQTSSTGQESATLTTQDIDFTPAQKTSATTGSWTGVNEITISGLKQGQYYADIAGGYNYECHVDDKCNRVPNVNLTPITTNLIYPLNEIATTSGTLIGDNSYILNNASQVVMALPATGVQGDVITISGKGAGGWRVTVPNTQQIVGGLTNTLTNGSGYIQAGQYAAVTLKCITGGTAAVWEIVCINPATTLTIV